MASGYDIIEKIKELGAFMHEENISDITVSVHEGLKDHDKPTYSVDYRIQSCTPVTYEKKKSKGEQSNA